MYYLVFRKKWMSEHHPVVACPKQRNFKTCRFEKWHQKLSRLKGLKNQKSSIIMQIFFTERKNRLNSLDIFGIPRRNHMIRSTQSRNRQTLRNVRNNEVYWRLGHWISMKINLTATTNLHKEKPMRKKWKKWKNVKSK